METIKPWLTPGDEENPIFNNIDWNTYVPPEVEMIAHNIMKDHYDMRVEGTTVLATKPEFGGAIWKMDTDKGAYTLKLLHRKPNRSLFSIYAQDYLVGKGARVPDLIPAKDGKLFVHSNGKLWIVSRWIDSLIRGTEENRSDLINLCYGLGEFHRHTKKYIPPMGIAKASRLYKWYGFYDKIKTKTGWFKDVALYYQDIPASKNLLSVVDTFSQQAEEAIAKLKESPYQKIVRMGEAHWGLVHQDFGWSNGNFGPNGLWVIDLDGVSYDLPIRDLQKLITNTMKDLGKWDVQLIGEMIEAYHGANPIDRETFEVLLVDLSLPNDFYKNVKPMLFEPEIFLQTEMDPLLQQLEIIEETKWSALKELSSEKEKYTATEYKEDEGFTLFNFQKLLVPSDARVSSFTPFDSKKEKYDQKELTKKEKERKLSFESDKKSIKEKEKNIELDHEKVKEYEKVKEVDTSNAYEKESAEVTSNQIISGTVALDRKMKNMDVKPFLNNKMINELGAHSSHKKDKEKKQKADKKQIKRSTSSRKSKKTDKKVNQPLILNKKKLSN